MTGVQTCALPIYEVIAIYYDSYRNLVAQGVIRDYPRYARPSPFSGQFVPDPR